MKAQPLSLGAVVSLVLTSVLVLALSGCGKASDAEFCANHPEVSQCSIQWEPGSR